jgi:hypothetical protein
MCALVQVDRDLPTNEVEMYEERFQLLLGRWEQAKGIVPLSSGRRRAYMQFLMELANHLHERQSRSAKRESVLRFAEYFRNENLYGFPKDLINDCLHRGVLVIDSDDSISFGHLVYQEFLVAKWLCEQQPVKLILAKLLVPWWRNALNFYAVLKGNISSLVKEGADCGLSVNALNRLEEMLELAPLSHTNAQIQEWLANRVKEQRRTF